MDTPFVDTFDPRQGKRIGSKTGDADRTEIHGLQSFLENKDADLSLCIFATTEEENGVFSSPCNFATAPSTARIL